jgi:hypothetical protein
MSKRKTNSQKHKPPYPTTDIKDPGTNGQANAQVPEAPGVPEVEPAVNDTTTGGGPVTEPPKRPLVPGINLDSVALEQDYQESLATDDSPATVVVLKPNKDLGFFRAHPSHWKLVRMLEVKAGPDRGFYLVADAARKHLQSDENDDIQLFPARLTLCYSRDSGLFLWPLRIAEPGRDNQTNDWSQSALRICKQAETEWVKLFTKQGGNCYSSRPGKGIKTQPLWGGLDLAAAVNMAFEKRYITDPSDPLIRRLLGEE